jgi:hypothetical protein
MGADEVGIVHPGIVDVAARLHLGLDLLHHVALLDEVVGEPDAGDLRERLGQRPGLVVMGRDRLGDHVDLHAGEGLRGIHEPFHLLHLLFLRERRGLEFRIDPAAGLLHTGKGRAGSKRHRHGAG